MAQQIQEVFWLTSADRQQLLYVSPAFAAIWGHPLESLYTYPGGYLNLLVDSIDPSDRERVVAAFAEHLHNECKAEYRIIRPDGSMRWVRSHFFPVQNRFGETWAIAGFSEDITAGKRTEELLQQREQQFRAIVEHSPDVIFRMDRQLRHLYVNPVVEQDMGMPSQELLGKTDRELGIPEPDVSEWEQFFTNVFQTGKDDEVVLSLHEPNGLKYFQTRVVPEFAADGSVETILGIARDVTKNKQTEEELRESEERFRGVFEFAPIGIALTNLNGLVLKSNQAFQEIFGYSEEELQNLPLIQLTHPDDRTESLKFFQELLSGTRTHLSLEQRYFRNDHRLIWGNLSVAAIYNAHGLPEYTLCMIQDISDRKQAHLELQTAREELEKRVAERTAELEQINARLQQEIGERQQAQEKLETQKKFLQTIIDTNPNMIYVKDTQGKFVLVNQARADFLGTTIENVLGKTVADFNLNPADVESFTAQDQEVFTTLQPKFISEEVCQSSTGKLRWFQTIKKPLVSSEGQVSYIFGVSTDITQRKLAEEALRESEQRYRLLIERMNDGVAIVEEDGVLSYINEKFGEMLGYAPSDLIGFRALDLVDESDRKILQAQKARRRRGESGTYELTLKRKDGQKLLVIVSASPIWGTDDCFEGSFIVFTDITALKTVESQLQQAHEQLQAVLDAVPGFVSWISSEGRYLGVNRHLAESFNLSPDAFVGKKLGFLKNSPKFVEFMEQFLSNAAQTNSKIIEIQANSSTRNYLIAAQKYNQGTNAVAVGIDITSRQQAEEAVKAQKEFLQAVIDTNPNLIWVKDNENGIVLANQAVADFFGKTVEELIGKTNFDLNVNPADAEYSFAQDQEVLTTLQQKFIPEEAFPSSTGEVRWFQTIKKPLFSSDGEVYQVLGVSTDITERKLAQEELHKSHEFLQTVLDTNPNHIFVKDTSGKYVLVNQACADFCGITVEDMLGKTDTELNINQADAEQFSIHDRQIITTLQQQFFPEVACHNSRGEVHWFQTTKKPLFDPDGQVRYIFGVCTNITARKLAQEALRLSEVRFRLASDNIPDVFVIYDAHRRFQFVNAQGLRRSEKSLEEFLGKTDEEVCPDEVTQHYLPILQRAVETRSLQTGECSISLPHADTLTLIVNYVPLLNERGEIYQILGITHDITQRKQAEEKLRQSEEQLRQSEARLQNSLREKEVLLQEIHHRVKNNLQVISSLLDLQSQYIEDSATLEMFRESCNRVKSMALVHEKLYQSQDFARINFAEYVENLISYLFQVYTAQASNIIWDLDIEPINLNIDTAIPCGLIISELVSNALKYAFPDNEKGIINVAVHSRNESVTLIVKDNGIGFPENLDLNKVKTLGMQLVNVLTNQLNGTLELKRRPGTEFRLSLAKVFKEK